MASILGIQAPDASRPLRAVDNRLSGRLALVTGASGGIGEAIARSLAQAGCHLALHYNSASKADQMTTFVQELERVHPESVFVVCQADLSSAEEAQGLVPAVLLKLHGKQCPSNVEILVLNAGLGLRRASIDDVSLEDLRATLDVNVVAPLLLCQAVLPAMRKAQWGRIIANSSISGHSGTSANACHYAASKGALTAMIKNLANREAQHGITCNAVSPAMIESTGMIPKHTMAADDMSRQIASQIPLGRLGQPDEIASIFTMLAANGYMTGADVVSEDDG